MTGTRPWGGPYPNLPRVERVAITIDQAPESPHLFVIEGSGSTLLVEATGGAGNAHFVHQFRVLIGAYVKGDDQVVRSTWLQRLWDDVVRTLVLNETLGGLCRDLVIDGPLETDEGEYEPYGAFSQPITITIDEQMSTP